MKLKSYLTQSVHMKISIVNLRNISDLYLHDEVFDDIRQAPFTVKEAAEYLEVAEITLRRWVKAGKINCKRMGRNIVFDADKLKVFKKDKRIEKS